LLLLAEPQSGFHFDPIVVCDFTALYPSLIIAYNLCYSSCAGKLDYHSTRQEMRREGQTTGRIGPFHYAERRTASVIKHHMKSISSSKKDKDRAYVTPNGSLFVSETVVKGVLPQVLDEILATRAMLKRAAKTYKKRAKNVAPSVLRSLEAKQLALKYVANVSYGYTSATFSGRSAMPLLADAIVECGRRTLTNAIELANNWGRKEDGRWKGAHVVYGDTDSVFIKLPNRSVEEAFAFGEQFCKAVTGSNPPPVQIKLEKVYVASLLQTKKKYCGMKYESPNDKRPVFEAKGIETVRRDQCALTQKVLRNALISVFQNGLESTKEYLQRQWALIHAGRLPVSDYILTGRVRSHYRGGKIGPVQAALARRLAEADPGRTVRHKERIPYVIVAAPGLNFKLRDCVLTPTECLEQWDAYTIHAAYYIKKHVNASLQRCFGLPPFKVDVNAWYEAAPKPRKRIHHWPVTRTGSSAMITAHFGSDSCALCGAKCKAKGSSRAVVCVKCSQDKVSAAFVGMGRLNAAEQDADAVARVCAACNGCPESSSTFAIDKTPLTNDSNRGGPGRGRAPTTSSSGLGSLFRKSTAKTSTGVVTPLAACVCIDCPITYERHRLREAQIEAEALCRAIDIL
jgi:DNA polymerase zeta